MENNNVTKIKEVVINNIETIFINGHFYEIDIKEEHYSNGILVVTAFSNGIEIFSCQTNSKNYWIGDNKTWSLKLDVLENLAYMHRLSEKDFYKLINSYGYSINDMYSPYDIKKFTT